MRAWTLVFRPIPSVLCFRFFFFLCVCVPCHHSARSETREAAVVEVLNVGVCVCVATLQIEVRSFGFEITFRFITQFKTSIS